MNSLIKSRWLKPFSWTAGAAVTLLLAWHFAGGDGIDRSQAYKIAFGNDVPFHFKGQDGRATGLAVELVSEAARVAKIKLEWVEAQGNWRDHADFLVLFTYQAARLKTTHITKPYLQTETSFIVPAGGPIRVARDLAGARISFVNYGIHRDNLAVLLPGMKAVPANNSRAALENVISGRADAAYLSDYAITPSLLQGGLQSPLRILPSGAPKGRMGIASTLAKAPVANVIRESMKTLTLDGSMERIVNRWGFFPNLTTDKAEDLLREQRKVRVLTLGVLLLFLSVFASLWLLFKLRRHARRLREAGQTQAAILNGLPAHLALIDAQGVILAANESWLRGPQGNALLSPDHGLGRTYLEGCERHRGEGSVAEDVVTDVVAGIREVLQGNVQDFNIEYPCPSPSEPRWFRLIATPVRDTSVTGAVVMHLDITARKIAEEALRRHSAEIQAQNEQLSRFNRAIVGRELQMIALKREIDELCQAAGLPARYAASAAQQLLDRPGVATAPP